MNVDKVRLVTVRVADLRSLSLHSEGEHSLHYVAGDELELPDDEARQLIADGIVTRA